VVQQTEAEPEQLAKVGTKLFQEFGERVKKLETEIAFYRNMTIKLAMKLATREGVEVPDFVKDESGGLGEEQAGQLREWVEQLLGQLAAGEETTTTTGRTSSRKRGRVGRGSSRRKRVEEEEEEGKQAGA
jgi:hypothetical protein